VNKFLFCLIACFFIASPALAINQGDTVYIDYDLQGGVNNPDNRTFIVYDLASSVKYSLLPPTKEGAEFIGWFTTKTAPLADNIKKDALYPFDQPNNANGKLKLHARWGVVSKEPQKDDAGCLLVHDAAELYGAVKSTEQFPYRSFCIFIEDDIVVNKNVLASDGSVNKGDFYWWKPFGELSGIIEGNGHTISGLYGNVGLVGRVEGGNLFIKNLGITDSYFSGENPGAFVSTLEMAHLQLKNVYSTASVISTSGYVGGLIGSVNAYGDFCMEPAGAAPLRAARNPSAYTYENTYTHSYQYAFVSIENAYSAGYLAGEQGGGLAGVIDNISIRNSFYAGNIDVTKKFSGIGLQAKKTCQILSENDVIFENVFYSKDFRNDGFENTPVSATEFSNGTVLKKLKDSTDIPIWVQGAADAYPKLSGAFYDITYKLNGGTNDATNPAYYTPKQEVALKPAVKENDVFEGWFADSLFTDPVDKIASSAEGDQKFFARWESGYSITYVNDGNYKYASMRNPAYRYADSSTYVLHEPTKDSLTFEGWYTDSTFKTRVTELVQGNKDDIVLIGKWSDGTVKIRKTVAPVPFKLDRVRKYDIKGRNPKSRPNYGVYF